MSAPVLREYRMAALDIDAATEPLESALHVDQVVNVLRAAGVRGVPASACGCALAEFVRLRLESAGIIAPMRVDVYPSEHAEDETVCDVTLGGVMESRVVFGPAVTEFVAAFDRGDFPELVKGEAE